MKTAQHFFLFLNLIAIPALAFCAEDLNVAPQTLEGGSAIWLKMSERILTYQRDTGIVRFYKANAGEFVLDRKVVGPPSWIVRFVESENLLVGLIVNPHERSRADCIIWIARLGDHDEVHPHYHKMDCLECDSLAVDELRKRIYRVTRSSWNAPVFCTSGYERFGWVMGNGLGGSLC